MSQNAPNLHKPNMPSTYHPIAQNVKLTLYVGVFTVGYVIASVLFMMLQTQIAVSPQLVTLLSILVGAYIAVHKFVKHQARALSKSEISRLTFGGTAVVWLMTALYFLAIWLWLFDSANRQVFIEMSMQQPLPLLLAFVVIMLLTFISAFMSIWVFNRLLAPK